jgi:hypothetical protein
MESAGLSCFVVESVRKMSGKCRHSVFSNMGGMIVTWLDHVTFSMTFSITFSICKMLSCPL